MRTVVALLILSALCAAQTTASAAAPTIVVPAGTKVPLVLKNAVSTKSARPGDAVYLQTTFPITQNNRIVIPAGAYVQGVINRVQHAGRVKGKAEVQMHFTTMIFDIVCNFIDYRIDILIFECGINNKYCFVNAT